ncbi:MAG: aspartate/glutamate racemase family protein [Burkholderiales bacterium]|nr:aspartate/glutamate racemase family protein [Burkholderiales bacterium]
MMLIFLLFLQILYILIIDELRKNSPIKILSILDVITEKCIREGYRRVAVLGTKWTMSNPLYKNIFDRHKIQLIIPDEETQDIIHKTIFEHLIPQVKIDLAEAVLTKLVKEIALSCDAIALACTELPMILNEKNCNIAVIDTTRTLAYSAVLHIKSHTK